MFAYTTLLAFALLQSTIWRAAAWQQVPLRGVGQRAPRPKFGRLRLSHDDVDRHDDPSPSLIIENLQSTTAAKNGYMRAMGISPRRIFISGLSAMAIALAGNLFGVTSQLLTIFPEDVVEASGLDTYFPRGEFKRCTGQGYSFVYPTQWVADAFVALAKAQRQAKSLDYRITRSGASVTVPDEAFGPPGRLNKRGVSEQGDTNVSVVVSSVMPGFSLKGTLGDPTSAAQTLLRVSLAPEGSGRSATLLSAGEDSARQVYQFEYTVDRGDRGPPLRAISVIAARNSDAVVTLTVVAPSEDWRDENFARKLRKVANSFHVVRQ